MNILFLTHRLPFAPNRGDRIRAYYELRELSRFSTVSLFSLIHDDEEEKHRTQVPFSTNTVTARVSKFRNAGRALMALATGRPLTHALLDAGGAVGTLERLVRETRPDLVLAYCSGMARFALTPPLQHLPFVLDMVDVDSLKWRQLSAEHSGPLRWVYAREARTLGAFEHGAVAAAKCTLVVNAKEREALAQSQASGSIVVVPNGVELDAFLNTGPPSEEPRVVFVGVMNYFPNDEGARWFLKDIWPRVRQKRPDALFTIVGRSPTPELRAAVAQVPGVELTGEVDDVRRYLHRSALSVAPLRLARGLQNKVLEALAAGLPVVVTPEVFVGLPKQAHSGCVQASDADAFADAVIRQLDVTAGERRARAAAAQLEALSWQHQLAPLEGILRNAIESRAR